MIFFMAMIMVLTLSFAGVSSRSLRQTTISQQLLLDLQSARSRLNFELKNGLAVNSSYPLGKSQISVLYHLNEATIQASQEDISFSLELKALTPQGAPVIQIYK